MRFEIEQSFPYAAERVIELYADPGFFEGVPREQGAERIAFDEVLSHVVRGDRVDLRIRYHFVADLPRAALAILDPARLSWVEATRLDLAAGRTQTTILPDHYADRLEASADARFTDGPDGTSLRTVRGSLKVRALLVGMTVERAIVDGMRDHFRAEARHAASLLAGPL